MAFACRSDRHLMVETHLVENEVEGHILQFVRKRRVRDVQGVVRETGALLFAALLHRFDDPFNEVEAHDLLVPAVIKPLSERRVAATDV